MESQILQYANAIKIRNTPGKLNRLLLSSRVHHAYTFWDCVERRHVIALFLCCDDATQPAKVTVLSPKSNSLRLSNESKRCAVFAVFPVTVNVDQYISANRLELLLLKVSKK
uniref:Uncharacterized protein n=1 Tax=Daphnia galeata TaxID=27404 RepID=A0A8J2RX60_9CRUS|nr:unnamed protein product [Daphnia galeata]